jgi:PAS domain S-box-containing protein
MEWMNWWDSYTAYMRKVTLGKETHEVRDLAYWQDNVFYKTISYAVPLSILFLLSYTLICLTERLVRETLISSITLACILTVCFNARLTLTFKKIFIAIILTMLAVVFLTFLGNFGIGSIYLLALSVYMAIYFSRGIAYGAVFLNFIIYGCLALIIHFRAFDLPVSTQYSTATWLGYSLNFLFFDLVMVYEISYLLYGLKHTLVTQQVLAKELQVEVMENMKQNGSLKESEDHYKSLFINNPTPMWIFDPHSLKFLQVNSAAVRKYGYTEEEFLQLKIIEIKVDPADVELASKIKIIENDGTFHHLTRHKGKDGAAFHVEINCSTISFKGEKVILTIATDVSTHIEHLEKIEHQNQRFKDIAYLQSHVIRAPLARMKGLYQLIALSEDEAPDKEIMEHFYASLNEMDEVIHTIVNHNERNSG